jgi:hypothetical protein
MLERLDDIAWDELRDAYGPADGIPQLLRDLNSKDADTREEAREQLWMGLCHQGVSLSEASAAAVPLLVELASHPRVKERAAILELLQGMAEAAHAPDGDEAAAKTRLATQQALAAEVSAILALLSDGDADVRARACLVAAELSRADAESARTLTDALGASLRTEQAADTRVALVEALERLSAYAPLRAALEDPAFAVRLAAALALVRVDAPDAASFRILRPALLAPNKSREQYGEAMRFRPLDWVKRICAAGPHTARALLPELLGVLLRGSPSSVDDDLAPLLDTFFPHGLPAEPSLEQSALAATIAQHRGYFGYNANADAVLNAHGLPTRPALLRAHARLGPPEHAALVPHLPALPAAPELLKRLIGGRSADQVSALFLVGVASDELLALLPGLPQLRHLSIKGAAPGPPGFAALARLERLEQLWLEDISLGAESALRLAALPCLARLTLLDVRLAPGALALLRTAPSLKTLTVEEHTVTLGPTP